MNITQQKTESNKQPGTEVETRGLHASDMVVMLTDVSDRACEE